MISELISDLGVGVCLVPWGMSIYLISQSYGTQWERYVYMKGGYDIPHLMREKVYSACKHVLIKAMKILWT